MEFKIGRHSIGEHFPTFIIAELSANHNQNYDNAVKLIHEAYKAGANAVKLQTYTPDTITLNCDKSYFQLKDKGTLWDGQTLYNLYSKAYTPWEWHKPLKEEANKLGMELFSSPFDVTAVDYLEKIDFPAYKIASFEVTDHILLKRVAQTGKPVILSTGITELGEIYEAVEILKKYGSKQICILKCTSAYPASLEDANLKTIQAIKDEFDVIAGLSDHTTGVEVPIASVCLGARIIEKHFTLDKNSGSPDDAFSLNPVEFKQMVDSVRNVEKAIGKVKFEKSAREKRNRFLTRSLFVCQDVKTGDIISKDNIRSVRPHNGMHTKHYDHLLGRTFKKDVEYGEPLHYDMIG